MLQDARLLGLIPMADGIFAQGISGCWEAGRIFLRGYYTDDGDTFWVAAYDQDKMEASVASAESKRGDD